MLPLFLFHFASYAYSRSLFSQVCNLTIIRYERACRIQALSRGIFLRSKEVITPVLRCLYLFASCLPFTLTRAHFFLQARNFITVRYKAVSILQRAYLKQRLHRLRRVSDSERLSESLRCIPYRRETNERSARNGQLPRVFVKY